MIRDIDGQVLNISCVDVRCIRVERSGHYALRICGETTLRDLSNHHHIYGAKFRFHCNGCLRQLANWLWPVRQIDDSASKGFSLACFGYRRDDPKMEVWPSAATRI
jgi:hypothetical protein